MEKSRQPESVVNESGAASPLVTIGMPVYNGSRWLHSAVTSILEQTFRDFILVICDNASTDDTEKIAREFSANDSRVRYHRNAENIGIYRNYNKVISFAESKYFKWASGNDLCAPTFLEECVGVLESDPDAVLAYPRTIVFQDHVNDGSPYCRDPEIRDVESYVRFNRVLDEIELNNPFNGVMSRKALCETSLNRVHARSDIVLLAELALRGTFRRVDDYLFFRRINPSASSSAKDATAARKFFEAEGRDIQGTPRWDFYRSCFDVAMHSPVSWGDRYRCISHILSLCKWDRIDLWREARGRLRADRLH